MRELYKRETERHYQLGKKQGRALYLTIGAIVGIVVSFIVHVLTYL